MNYLKNRYKKTLSLLLAFIMTASIFAGSTSVKMLSGDCNGDEIIDNKDIIVLFRYISGSPENVVIKNCDYNSDGKISNKDVTTLFRFLSIIIEESKTNIKKPKCRYSSTSIRYSKCTETLDIYIPADNGYIDYIIGHGFSDIDNADVWSLIQVDAVDKYLNIRNHITLTGENEMAIKIQGRDDFIGGVTHGDEILLSDSFSIFLNGQKSDISVLKNLTEFDTLKISLVSSMYDPDDHITVVGNHSKEWLFNKEGFVLSQTVEFKEDLTLVSSYMPMLCAIRGNDTVSDLQITDTYVDDGNFQEYDVGTGGFTTYPNILKTGIHSVHLFGKESKVDIQLELLEQPEGLNGGGVFLFNRVNTYNKIYCAICGYNNNAQTVKKRDIWRVKSKIAINIRQ